MNKNQNKIKKDIETLIWLIFQECGINDNKEKYPPQLKSSLFQYKNNQNLCEVDMWESKIRVIQGICGDFIRKKVNENKDDLNRVYDSISRG